MSDDHAILKLDPDGTQNTFSSALEATRLGISPLIVLLMSLFGIAMMQF